MPASVSQTRYPVLILVGLHPSKSTPSPICPGKYIKKYVLMRKET